MPSTLDRLGYEAGQLLKILGALASVDGGPAATLRSLGWDLPPGAKDIGLAAMDVSGLVQKLEALEQSLEGGASDAVLAAQFAQVLLEFQNAITNVRGAIAGLSAAGDYLDKTQIKSEILERFSSLLIVSRLGAVSPLTFLLLQFFGVIVMHHFDADPTIYQVDHIRMVFDWNALLKLFTDPLGLLKARYGWGTAVFDARGFIAHLNAIVEVLGEPSRVRTLPRRVEEQLSGKPVPEADSNPVTQVIGNFIAGDLSGGLEAGISLFPLRPTTVGGLDAGIAVCPFVYGSADVSFPLTDQLTLDLQSTVGLDSGVALQFRPGQDMSIKAGLLTGSIEDQITGTVMVSLTWAAPTGSKMNLISLPGGGVVEVASISFAGGADVLQGKLSPSFALKLTGGHASLKCDGADSFLSSIVPAGGVDATFDIGVRWSADHGFSFEGSASAAIDLALNDSIGPLLINSIHLGLAPSASDLSIEISVTCAATVGPVGVTLQRFGALVSVAATDGNLGPIDVGLHFKPPSGAGLSVDAAGVSGGGFLSFDPAKQEYSGVLQLQFTEFALQAFGLITTQVAGGSGFSLLALIDANFPPIQLGWGFTLNGVGGLLAVHRTADVDALHAALKADKLSTILFPKNAIQNAPQILAQLDALFPTAPGRFLFGPMALIGWGTPTVLTVALAVIVELPEPIRIILIARLALRLPSDSGSKTPVRINMDALGVLDLSQDTLSLDATLFDSKIMSFTLAGDMALRVNWSSQRQFLLAIGGFHPQFTPPAGFPMLQRVAIGMSSGNISKLRLAAYLAVTSNTVQFGASLDVFIGVDGFGLAGHLGFDALLQISPFHFEADISGSIALTAGGDNLMSVSLDATLSGPAPWNIAGSFKIHIIFFDVSKSFSYTWGDGAPAAPIPAVDVLPLLTAAFADSRNWGAQLPESTSRLVSLRSQDGSTLVVHPLSQLEVHESVAPLDLQIARFGAAPLAGATTFTITDFRLNGWTLLNQTTAVQDDFAPAQFFNLSNDQKLAGPSFEQHNAGLVLPTAAPSVGPSAPPKTTTYETLYINQPGQTAEPEATDTKSYFSILDLKNILPLGSSARAEIRHAGKLKFQAPGKPVTVTPRKFVVATTSALVSAGLTPASGVTYSEARALLTKAALAAPAQRTQLQILATNEMAAS